MFATPQTRMAILSFAVGAAAWPGFLSGASMPRWWVIAIGLPFVMPVAGPRRVDRNIAFLLWVFALLAVLASALVPIRVWVLDALFMGMLGAVMVAHARLDNAQHSLQWLAIGVATSVPIFFAQMAGWIGDGIPAGLFFNSAVFSEVAAVLAVWALWRGRFVLGMLLAVVPFLAMSRIGVATIVLGGLIGWQPRYRWFKVLVLATMVFGAGAAFLSMWKFASAMDRILLWSTAIYSITPFGSGLGTWGWSHPDPLQDFVHSDFLQALTEAGVAGLFLMLAAIFIVVRGKDCHVAERAAFGAAVFQVAVSFPLHLPANGYAVAALAGALAGRSADLCRHRHARGDDLGSHIGWFGSNGRAMAGSGGQNRAGVSVGSAFDQDSAGDSHRRRSMATVEKVESTIRGVAV